MVSVRRHFDPILPERRRDLRATTALTPATPAGAAPSLPPLPRSNEIGWRPDFRPGGIMGWVAAHRTPIGAVLMGASGLATLTGFAAPAMAATRDVAPASAPRQIIYVGMNADSKHEVEALKGIVGQNGLVWVKNAQTPDQIKVGTKTYDLSTDDGRAGFAKALGLEGDRADALAAVLNDVGDGGRDELAQLSVLMNQAEKNQRVIERVVLSGHNVGYGVWGDSNGTLDFTSLGKLALVFPKAAGQVQDLMLAACYSGGQSAMDTYRAIFPNVKTIWAYDGSAPGAVSGAVPHVLRWERGTRGTATGLDRDAAKNTRKGEYVAVWTVSKGYDNGQPQSDIASDRASYESSKTEAADFISGKKTVTDSQSGPLRSHYNDIQRLLGRQDLPQAERTQLEGERDLTIRLLYYKNVKTMFQTLHGSSLASAYQQLGLTAPDFSKLSRAEALDEITKLDAAIEAKGSVSAQVKWAQKTLHDGLRDLLPSAIPATWI